MYKSQFQKIDTYNWFCGPGSHLGGITQIFPHRFVDMWGGVFEWGVLARSGSAFSFR